jgi:hypothetical protein
MKAPAGAQPHLIYLFRRIAPRAILFLCFSTFLALSHGAFSQITTQGTDFYVAFGSNMSQTINSLTMQIKIAAKTSTDVTFTFTNDGNTLTVPVPEGGVYTLDLNNAQRTGVYNDVSGAITAKSLRIQSTEPVSVYALNQCLQTADATCVLPVNNLGTKYYHFSYTPQDKDAYLVIATENQTEVYENGSLQATLNTGQVYCRRYAKGVDVTGRHITSTRPVAYFVANGHAGIPPGTGGADHFFEQIPPVNAWGNHFLVPVTHRAIERIRIVASQDGTVVTQSGGVIQTAFGTASLTLNAGEFVELETTLAAGGCYISANKPVGVCAYMMSMDYPPLADPTGDPSLTWIPPVEQAVAEALIAPFVPSVQTSLINHYALIVTATATKDQTTVAIGTAVPAALSGGAWTVGANSDYSFYSMPLTSTSESYSFHNPDGLTVTGYGVGFRESYGYMAGAAARSLNDNTFYINDISYADIHQKQICCAGQLTLSFRADIRYIMSTVPGYLKWYINGVEETSATDVLEWNKTVNPGAYTVTMEVLDISNNRTHTLTSTVKTGPCFIPINPHIRSSVVGN